jgi:hypothetical protein
MAANPLPRPRRNVDTPPVYLADAAAGDVGPVIQSQPIQWTNDTTDNITITIQRLNGNYPLTENSFTVNGTGGPVNTHLNAVLGNASVGNYTFTRSKGVIPMGSGRIIVQTGNC